MGFMTATIIDGKAIAADIKNELKGSVASLAAQGIVPGLAAVLVGEDPPSQVYVSSKRRAAKSLGMKSRIHRVPETAAQSELEDLLSSLNEDPAIHGILLQLPLPKGLDPAAATEIIAPDKDVDCLTATSHGLLALGRPRFVPCTPLGVKVLLERIGTKVEGANVVVVGRSNLVGRPLSILLSLKASSANATVTLCHTGTTNLDDHTRHADILVVAAGTPRGVTGEMIKPGATVIDVGITRDESGVLVGDVDFDSAVETAGAITPVPGGVGPMTVAMLMSNTVQAAS